MVKSKASSTSEAFFNHCSNCKLVLVHEGLFAIAAELQIFVSRMVIITCSEEQQLPMESFCSTHNNAYPQMHVLFSLLSKAMRKCKAVNFHQSLAF